MDEFWNILEQVGDWIGIVADVVGGIGSLLAGINITVGAVQGILAAIVAIGALLPAAVAAIGAIGAALAALFSTLVTVLIGFLTFLVTAVGVVGAIAIALFVIVVVLIVEIIVFFVTAHPYHKLGKKTDVKLAWMALLPIPVLSDFIRLYMLAMIPGERPVSILGNKVTLPNRFVAFWALMAIFFILLPSSFVIFVVLGFLFELVLALIPGIGAILTVVIAVLFILFGNLLMLPINILFLYTRYVVLYDVLCTFKENKTSNVITSIVLTLIDTLFVGTSPIPAFASSVYLYTLLRRDPIASTTPKDVPLLESAQNEEGFAEDTTIPEE